jgi:DMSO/TMAO reductase YedYZ molybdopterin-dependent catalytic subunit
MQVARLPFFAFACVFSVFAQSEAKLVISGDIPGPLTITAADIAAMPRESIELNDPETAEHEGGKFKYEGVALQEVLKKAGIPFGSGVRGKWLAAYVLASAKDGYQVVYSLGELDASFGNERVLIVDKRDGKPLFGYQGPLRLVVAGDKAGARDVRMLEKLEIVRLRK